MGSRAFSAFLKSIQSHIGSLNTTVDYLERKLTGLMARSEDNDPEAQEAVRYLAKTQDQLGETRTAIEELKRFYVKMKKQWTKPKDRVIGHVVWAPPFSVSTAPHNYTKDVCVIKLDEKKFLQNFRGNVLDFGMC